MRDISPATTDLETARTVLQVTMEYFKLSEINLPKEDRQAVGLQVEAIGTMLNVVDDYMFRAVETLTEKGAIYNDKRLFE